MNKGIPQIKLAEIESDRNSLEYGLTFADGSNFLISAADKTAQFHLCRLAEVMRLDTINNFEILSSKETTRKLIVATYPKDFLAPQKFVLPHFTELESAFFYYLESPENEDDMYVNLMKLSLALALDVQLKGGILLHGVLAEWKGNGVIFAAPGGTGKTTASNRLPLPWRSLCDDATLVTKDIHGNFWAHPWPTWSRFYWGGQGGTWNAQEAVPLKRIFFLQQSKEDRVEGIGQGKSLSLLMESAKQISLPVRHLPLLEQSKIHIERFNNVCVLIRTIPVDLLHISLTGLFWKEIENLLEQPTFIS